MPRLLICGHGFLGEAVGRLFLGHGWEVLAVSRSVEAERSADGYRLLACDLGEADQVAALARAIPPPDLVLHCASSGRGGAEAYARVYVGGCRLLAETFPQATLIFTSSTSVYGQIDGSVVTEESPASPDRETGRLLLEAERIVRQAGGVVARLSGIYGPGRSIILRRFLEGEAKLEEDGRRFLNQIHRDDAAGAILTLASRPEAKGGLFNVSDSKPLAQIDCLRALAERFGRALPPSVPRDPDRKRGWTHKRVSNERLRGLGWEPAYPCFLDAVDDLAPTLGWDSDAG